MIVKNLKHKKGFTLAEMIVTLVAFGVLSAMIVAFATMINKSIQTENLSTKRINEIGELRTFVSDWFYNFDNSDFYVDSVRFDESTTYDFESDTYITQSISEVIVMVDPDLLGTGIISPEYKLIFTGNTLTAGYGYGSQESEEYTSDLIEGVSFDWDKELKLMKCSVIFKDIEKPYVFVLYKHS